MEIGFIKYGIYIINVKNVYVCKMEVTSTNKNFNSLSRFGMSDIWIVSEMHFKREMMYVSNEKKSL